MPFSTRGSLHEATDWRDSFDLLGAWWLPETPEKQVPGVLSVNVGGEHVLHLAGQLLTHADPWERIVHGVTRNGTEVTLREVLLHYPGRSPRHGGQEAGAQAILFGRGHGHIGSDALNSLAAMTFELNNLHKILRPRRPRTEYADDGHNRTIYTSDAEVVEVAPSGLQAQVRFRFGFSGAGGEEVRLSPWAQIEIEPDSPQPDEWFENVRLALERLFMLLSGKGGIFTKSMTYYLPKDDRGSQASYTVLRCHEPRVRTEIEGWPLFHRLGGALELERTVDAWFRKLDILDNSAVLLLGIDRERTAIETQIIDLTRCLEAYHRVRYPDESNYVEAKQYTELLETLVAAIPNGLPSDFVDSLKTRLKFGNEISLRSRLKKIYDRLPDAVRGYLPERATWAEQVVGARNELAHVVGISLSGDIIPRLAAIVTKLRFVCWGILLCELDYEWSAILGRMRQTDVCADALADGEPLFVPG